jgi:hypothetical protein
MCFQGGCAKVMFVTTDIIRGPEIGGVAGADAKCQQSAQAAGLMGTYRAWIATTTYSPAGSWPRPTVPYVNRAGAIVANGWSDLVSGNLVHAVGLTEFGQVVDSSSQSAYYWTGANSAGFGTGNDCAGWTTVGGSADIGRTNSLTLSSVDTLYCGPITVPWNPGMVWDGLASLLCVEQ